MTQVASVRIICEYIFPYFSRMIWSQTASDQMRSMWGHMESWSGSFPPEWLLACYLSLCHCLRDGCPFFFWGAEDGRTGDFFPSLSKDAGSSYCSLWPCKYLWLGYNCVTQEIVLWGDDDDDDDRKYIWTFAMFRKSCVNLDPLKTTINLCCVVSHVVCTEKTS